MSFNRKSGRFMPYGEYPEILAQNNRVRQMNSLVQRNAANLYIQYADPFGANPLGEFGTDISGDFTGIQNAYQSIIRDVPAATEEIDDTEDPPITEPPPKIDDDDDNEDDDDDTEDPPPTTDDDDKDKILTEEQVANFKYNSVQIPYAVEYKNIPWFSWQYDSKGQKAMNFLQANGDELILQFKARKNQYPELAKSYQLPCTNPIYTLYDYSDLSMMYLSLYRHPINGFKYDDKGFQRYLERWSEAMKMCFTFMYYIGTARKTDSIGGRGGPDRIQYSIASFTWDDWKELLTANGASIPLFPNFAPSYYNFGNKQTGQIWGDGDYTQLKEKYRQHYFTYDYVVAYRRDRPKFLKMREEGWNKVGIKKSNTFHPGNADMYEEKDPDIVPNQVIYIYDQIEEMRKEFADKAPLFEKDGKANLERYSFKY